MRHGTRLRLIGLSGTAGAWLSAAAPVAAATQDRALEYAPQALAEGRAADAAGLGWLLIAAAIVLAVVIVGFVIRHHRSGRAG